jgi:hypothetical protein
VLPADCPGGFASNAPNAIDQPDLDRDGIGVPAISTRTAAAAVARTACSSSPWPPTARALDNVSVTLSDGGAAGGTDGDGFADRGELLKATITVKNNSADSIGAPLALTNVVIGISSSSASVSCITDSTSTYGSLAPGEEKSNPPGDAFEFIVAGDNSARTLALTDIKRAVFSVTVSADQIKGQEAATSFSLTLDLDILGDTTGGGPLGGTGTLFENFESEVGTAGLITTFGRTGLTLADVIPVVPAINCLTTPLGPPDCSQNTSANDWHLHGSTDPLNNPDGEGALGSSRFCVTSAPATRTRRRIASARWARSPDRRSISALSGDRSWSSGRSHDGDDSDPLQRG